MKLSKIVLIVFILAIVSFFVSPLFFLANMWDVAGVLAASSLCMFQIFGFLLGVFLVLQLSAILKRVKEKKERK